MNNNSKENKTMALVFRYVSLVIKKKRTGEEDGELEKIRKNLGLSHKEIIQLAAKNSK